MLATTTSSNNKHKYMKYIKDNINSFKVEADQYDVGNYYTTNNKMKYLDL